MWKMWLICENEEGVASNQSSWVSRVGCVRPARSYGSGRVRRSVSVGPGHCASDSRSWIKRTGSAHVFANFSSKCWIPLRLLSDAGCNTFPCQEYTSDGQTMDSLGSRCKIVVVGDTQCGKTALLHVFAKDCYPEVGPAIKKSLNFGLSVEEGTAEFMNNYSTVI